MKTNIWWPRGILYFLFPAFFGSVAFANPVGGIVARGGATITPGGNILSISQFSQRAIINWNSFSIASGETTIFQFNSAYGANSAVLNRVSGSDASTIAGMLRSTIGAGGPVGGTVLIFNPNGILF